MLHNFDLSFLPASLFDMHANISNVCNNALGALVSLTDYLHSGCVSELNVLHAPYKHVQTTCCARLPPPSLRARARSHVHTHTVMY